MTALIPDLKKALDGDKKAKAQWDTLTPVARRDFSIWITSAKQDATRARRVTVSLSKLRAGERRPCCYTYVPMNLYKALSKQPKAKQTWSGLTPDERRDIAVWVNGAKDSEQRSMRIDKATVALMKGKKKVS